MSPVLRDATDEDLPALHELDRLCFPPGDVHREPAAEGEIEQAVRGGRVRVVEVDSTVVASLLYEMPVQNHVYLSGLAVHPDWRRRGYAGLLLDDILHAQTSNNALDRQSISTATSPANLPMLSLLLSRGFVVRRRMADYFGPGRDRYYCQYKVKIEYIDPDERFIVPVTAEAHIQSLLDSGNYAITGMSSMPWAQVLEISHFERDDLATLQSDETAAGVAFASGILAAITFLLGLSFASANYPDAVRIMLMGAALATTVSLIIYANTSGELARLRTNVFSHHMKWGNALSEFGGVYPFLISLPVAFGRVSTSVWAGLASAVFVTAALFMYERSTFSIFIRFRQSLVTQLLSLTVAGLPLSGVLTVRYGNQIASWIWAGVAAVALTGMSAIFLTRRGDESLTPQLVRRWQSRR